MVAFDTNVFMGSAKDRNIILECVKAWSGADSQIAILLPRVSCHTRQSAQRDAAYQPPVISKFGIIPAVALTRRGVACCRM